MVIILQGPCIIHRQTVIHVSDFFIIKETGVYSAEDCIEVQ